jgi:hypothetical protein
LVQVLPHVDLSHHEFDEVHLHGLKSLHVLEDLRGDVVSLDLMVYAVHLPIDGDHQSELDAPLALNFARDVKDGMGVVLYLPSLHSPSRSSIIYFLFFTALYLLLNSREIKKGRS